MKWGRQQEEAISAVRRWLRNTSDQQVFRLFGYAGTGKTTLAVYLAENAGRVLFGAYTGKAASVMRKRGCSMAQTIHQLIYLPASRSKEKLRDLQRDLMEAAHELRSEGAEQEQIDKSTAIIRIKHDIEIEEARLKRPRFSLNLDSTVKDVDLVVIDECSMVDERMGQDLLSFDTPVLVLGDSAQLPPVRGGGFFTDKKPDIMLTEIHRQARNNPIIDLATKVRLGETLIPGTYGESVVMTGKPDPAIVKAADQILVGRNKTRRYVNFRMRALLGKEGEPAPVPGDRLVCLRNDHEAGLLNGTVWSCRDAAYVDGYDRIGLTVEDEDGDVTIDVEAHMHYFEGREDELRHWEIAEAQCFDYGYALTTHKAQGSQWPRVFVFNESHIFRGSARKWLYTAITRASEQITICQ